MTDLFHPHDRKSRSIEAQNPDLQFCDFNSINRLRVLLNLPRKSSVHQK